MDINYNKMPSVRTNFIRIHIGCQPLTYQTQLHSQQPLQPEYYPQIQTLIYQSLPLSIYSPPLLFTPIPIQQHSLQFFLSNGCSVTLLLAPKSNHQDMPGLLSAMCQRLMRLSELLWCQPLSSVFNPYQERTQKGQMCLPGFGLKAQTALEATGGVSAGSFGGLPMGIWVCPVVMRSLTQTLGGSWGESQVFLDYQTGKFLLKQNIVRIDKNRDQVHFRNHSVLPKSALRPVVIHPLNGHPLAHQLHSTLTRIQATSHTFTQTWNIKFDSRYLAASVNYIQPGHLTFRGGVERSLTQLVTPMSEYNWTHNFVGLFRAVMLYDELQAEVVWICTQKEKVWTVELAKAIDACKFRMGLKINGKMQLHPSLEQADQLVNSLKREGSQGIAGKIYILVSQKPSNKIQKVNLDKIIQAFIDQNMKFHNIQAQINNKQPSFQSLSYLHLILLYTKFCLNPWQIKSIPFSNTPMAAATIHVQPTTRGTLSVACVATMNLYMTKFTAARRECIQATLITAIQQVIRECEDKFKSVHSRYPNRMFVFRTGRGQQGQQWEQAREVKNSMLKQTGSCITYIMLTKQHNFRCFNQIDSSYISKDTAKRTQLLLFTQMQGELYMQLQLQQPMHRIRVYQAQKNDPNFMNKVLQLIAKLVFGGVGNGFGRGLGFVDYSRRMNQYRQFNWEAWRNTLKDGVLSFL